MTAHPGLLDLVEALRDDAELFGADGACPTLVERGGDGRLLLVSGDNAGGKSLVCRYLASKSREMVPGRDGEFMVVGMGTRTESGIHRAFMFGSSERDESTGKVSSHAIRGAFRTCQGREHGHVLCLDEPDIGLSERMAHGMGAAVAEFAGSLPALTKGLVVVTHSRPVAKALLALDPWCIRVGEDLRPTREWVEAPVEPATADEFWGLADRAKARRSAVQRILNARRADRAAARGPR